MAHSASAQQTHGPQAHTEHRGHPPTTIRQYVLIGLFLTIVTAVELWVSYSPFTDAVIIALLFVLSAVKFGTVVALFMHLKFEHPLFTRLFVFGLALAASIMVALLVLFAYDHTDTVPGRGGSGAPAPAGHGALIVETTDRAL